MFLVSTASLVADRCRRPIELRDLDVERLGVGVGAIGQNADADLLAQHYRPIGGAAEVNTGVDTMAKANVPGELGEFTVYG